MCGIAGLSKTDTDRTLDTVNLSRCLLRAIEARGRHAAGAAWTEEGDVWWDKAPVPGSAYAKRLPMGPLATTAILHTRFATKGDPKDNGNNHPFSLPGITGIHNGCLTNDAVIFNMLGVERTAPGKTDSEAIFALLAHRHPSLSRADALGLVEGDAAVAWIETSDPDRLHLARLVGRPLAIGETVRGSLVFASTETLLRLACATAGVRLNEVWDVPTMTYVTAVNGCISTVEEIVPAFAEPITDPRDHVPSVLRGRW